jgi:hypothetical protein
MRVISQSAAPGRSTPTTRERPLSGARDHAGNRLQSSRYRRDVGSSNRLAASAVASGRQPRWLPALVVAGLRRGVELIDRRHPATGAPLQAWLESILTDYADRILPVTVAIGQRWAVLAVPSSTSSPSSGG